MDRFLSSAITVGKVILVAVMGIWASRHFASKAESLKALSHIAVKIFLPSLLLSQLATDLSWEMIRKYYWAGIIPLIPMILGVLSAFIFRSFLPSELFGLLQLACTFQNVISYGLGITMNLKISWYDEEAKNAAQSYVFLYNVVHSLFLWSVGTMIIEKCALELEEKNELASIDVITSSYSSYMNSNNKVIQENIEIDNNNNNISYNPITRLEDYRPAIISAKGNASKRRKPTSETTWIEYIKLQLSYLLTEQLIASFIGILIALVPPFGYIVHNPVGEILIGGIALLAPGTVPLQLLVLGVNITADGDDSVKLPIKFLIGVILLRLFFIPVICFGIIHILVVNAWMTYDRPFILVMLVLTCAPTAINTSIICSIYSYKVKEYTKLLLFMYVTCIFTTTIWLTVYIWYLES